jgi:hypothetical protein
MNTSEAKSWVDMVQFTAIGLLVIIITMLLLITSNTKSLSICDKLCSEHKDCKEQTETTGKQSVLTEASCGDGTTFKVIEEK